MPIEIQRHRFNIRNISQHDRFKCKLPHKNRNDNTHQVYISNIYNIVPIYNISYNQRYSIDT